MRWLTLLSALLVSACGSNLTNPATRVQLPEAPPAYAITTIPPWPDTLRPTRQDFEHYHRTPPGRPLAMASASFAPAAPDMAPTFTVTPTDVAQISLCDPPLGAIYPAWNENRWFSVAIGGVQQPFSGPLVSDPASGPNCFFTQKVFTFPEGTHAVDVKTINHCAAGDTIPGCTGLVGDWPSAPTSLTVVSASQSCTYTLSASSQSFQAAGGTWNVAVTTQTGCAWTVSSGASWVTVSAASVTGPASLTFTVAANTTTAARTGPLTIAGQTFTVGQAGVSTVDQCVPPLGTESVSIFVTRWEPTSGKVPKPGALMRVNYQLSSKSPVREVYVKAGGVVLKRIVGTDVDLSSEGGMWVNAPAAGTYKLAVGARNVMCPAREVLSSVDLVVR